VQELRRKGGRVIGVVNVVGSTVARECDGGIYLHAGPEVSVTSTKAYTAMYVAFALLALHLGRVRDLSPADGRRIVAGLHALPAQIAEVLAGEEQIATLARDYAKYEHMLFVGRVRGWPVAREGAQKLKEVSYLHAEAYPSAELKHGPLALIGPDTPTVAVMPDDELFEKNLSTASQVRARGGRLLAIAQRELGTDVADDVIVVPEGEPELDPVLLGIPLQLLPTTSRWRWAGTSTGRATWPRASRSSSGHRPGACRRFVSPQSQAALEWRRSRRSPGPGRGGGSAPPRRRPSAPVIRPSAPVPAPRAPVRRRPAAGARRRPRRCR
jgi:hypothetical protein